MQRNFAMIAERLDRDGELITTAQAAKFIPAHSGKHKHASSSALVRWIREGKSAGKQRVYLDGVRAGRGWVTSKAAVLRFLAACSGADVAQDVNPRDISDMHRRSEIAKAKLRAAGVKC